MVNLPNASTANTESTATNTADVAAAQSEFIAATTVLINQAISNGLFLVQPVLPPLVTSAYVKTYFTNLGYAVLFPIYPVYGYNPSFVPGFPEVLPPGYINPFFDHAYPGPPRIQISWTS
jgi:hypothetical protein